MNIDFQKYRDNTALRLGQAEEQVIIMTTQIQQLQEIIEQQEQKIKELEKKDVESEVDTPDANIETTD